MMLSKVMWGSQLLAGRVGDWILDASGWQFFVGVIGEAVGDGGGESAVEISLRAFDVARPFVVGGSDLSVAAATGCVGAHVMWSAQDPGIWLELAILVFIVEQEMMKGTRRLRHAWAAPPWVWVVA